MYFGQLGLRQDAKTQTIIVNMESFADYTWFTETEPDPLYFSALDKLIIAQGLSATKRETVCLKSTEYV